MTQNPDYEKLIHDANNILCQITSRISLLEYDKNYGEEVNELAEESCEATDFLAKYLKRTVLMYHSIEKEIETINLIELLKEIIEDYKKINENINIVFNTESKIPEFNMIYLELRTIIEELINNACEENEYSEVIVTLFFKEKIKIIIENNGMVKNFQIFEKFNEKYYSSKDRTYHKGIGLPLINKLCQRNGIEIKFESKNNTTKVELLIDPDN